MTIYRKALDNIGEYFEENDLWDLMENVGLLSKLLKQQEELMNDLNKEMKEVTKNINERRYSLQHSIFMQFYIGGINYALSLLNKDKA